MAISSFYGLQTSLRGLLAQQRSLDVTGHNVANASTKGYSRQEASLAASDALVIPSGAVQSGAGAHLGSGVDVQAYRRVRDGFLDLQYRAQATRLGEEAGVAEGLANAELALAEPSDDGINTQLSDFWDAWSDLHNAPDDAAARQALVEQANSLAEAFHIVDDQLELAGQHAADEFATLTAPGGKVEQIAQELAQLNDTIKRFVTAGDAPNDLMDRRDMLLDELSSLGQVSVEDLGTGSLRITFGGAGDPPLVDDTTVDLPARAVGARRPARRPAPALGRAGRDRRLLPDRARHRRPHARRRGQRRALPGGGGNFFTFTNGDGGRLPGRRGHAGHRAHLGHGGQGRERPRAAHDHAARRHGRPGLRRLRRARRLARSSQANRQQANAQALTDAVDDRRQSVAGVSLDEEMTSLIRFQRAYQASSRAMSTMDEMLDVLINRTGRVGL